MRTRLTIDDDVAVDLKGLQCKGDLSLKRLINDALRRGLREMDKHPRKRKPFRTRSFIMGKPLVDIDNIAEAIAQAEGDAYK